MNRREFIRCGAGLAGIIAAGKAPAAVVRSMIGAMQTGIATNADGWANPYVTDGLVAMWDGIWNAGGGVHDSNATKWVDLTGNEHDLILRYNAHFDDNSLVSADRNYITAILATTLPYATIEICAFWDSSRNASGVVCFGNSIDNQRMMVINPQSIQTYNGSYRLILSEAVDPKSTWSGVHEGTSHIPYINGDFAVGTYGSNTWSQRTGTFGLSGSSNYSQWNFVGSYYNVRLYDRALSADEIASNYAIDKERFGV